MENNILKKLEEEKDKYLKNLDKNFESFSSYINYKYLSKDAIFYENTINYLILYKLMKNYSAVPDMIIDFIQNQNIDDIQDFENNKNIYSNILKEIQVKYVEKEYSKFIPNKKILNNIIENTKGKKICILDDGSNFLKYILKYKDINDIVKYNINIKFDVLIIYEDKLDEFIIEDIKNKDIIIILIGLQNKNILFNLEKYIIKEYNNRSILSYFKNIKFFLKNNNETIEPKFDNKKEKKIYKIYSSIFDNLKNIGYYSEAMELILPLIKFKCNKNKKDTPRKILNYLTNIYYQKIKTIINEDEYNGIELNEKLFSYYFMKEYSWSKPNINIINHIIDFVGNMKILEIASGIGFWSYLFKAYGLNIIPTGIKDNNFHDREEYWIKNWIEVENLTYEEAFKKYSDAEVLFLCWGLKYFNISNFNGKYIILIVEHYRSTFYIEDDDEKYKLLKKIKNDHIYGMLDYLFIYEKIK